MRGPSAGGRSRVRRRRGLPTALGTAAPRLPGSPPPSPGGARGPAAGPEPAQVQGTPVPTASTDPLPRRGSERGGLGRIARRSRARGAGRPVRLAVHPRPLGCRTPGWRGRGSSPRPPTFLPTQGPAGHPAWRSERCHPACGVGVGLCWPSCFACGERVGNLFALLSFAQEVCRACHHCVSAAPFPPPPLGTRFRTLLAVSGLPAHPTVVADFVIFFTKRWGGARGPRCGW